MSSVVLAVATLVTLIAAVGAIVTLIRRWPPTMDRASGRTVARALNRGRLPPSEPERSLAVRTARSRSANGWLALMFAGLTVLMVRNSLELFNVVPTGLWCAIAAVALTGIVLNAFLAVQARRALTSV